MSFLRPIEKIVNNTIYGAPNNHILSCVHRQVFLCEERKPHIDYLHSMRSYVLTLNILQQEIKKQEKNIMTKYASRFYRMYNKEERYYQENVQISAERLFLTPEAIGNIYYCADYFSLSPSWLQQFVLPYIKREVEYMSLINLRDTISGVQKYHPNNPILQILLDAEKKITFKEYIIVEDMNANVGKFVYSDQIYSSNEPWIKAFREQKPFRFIVYNYVKNVYNYGSKLPLHSEIN